MKNRLLCVLGLSLLLPLIPACAPGPRSYGQRFESTAEKTPLIESTFEESWSQRTIVLKPVAPERSGRSRGFAGQMGRGAGFDGFSFTAKATLMDSALIEAGLQQFAQLADMQENEFRAFRQRYYAAHSLGDTTFVWLQLETTISEKYLDLDLWEFYSVAEDAKNIKPVRLEAYAMDRKSAFGQSINARPWLSPADGAGPGIGYAAKGLALYFVKKGNKSETKLLVRRRLNPNIQVEGSWPASTEQE